MKPIFRNKPIKILLIMLLIDIVLMGGWVLAIKPSSSLSIVLIFAIPFVFIVNLLIAGVLFFAKRQYAKYLAVNSVMSPVLLVVLFVGYIKIDLRQELEEWEFKIDDVNCSISYWIADEDSTYYVTVFDNPEYSMGCGWGQVYTKDDTVHFYSVDSSRFYIVENYLYNFNNIEKIRVSKIY